MLQLGGRKGQSYDLEDRLIAFAVMVCRIVESLPCTRIGSHVAGQLTRCGVSPAANYGEAQAAESRKDFIRKLKICLKELRETLIWLEFSQLMGIGELAALEDGFQESNELVAIFVKSVETTERNRDRRS